MFSDCVLLDFQGTLESFRQQWKKEVQAGSEEFQEDSDIYEKHSVVGKEKTSFGENSVKVLECDIEKQVQKSDCLRMF